MYVLDTNVLSELRHGKPNASVEVLSWADSVRAEQCFTSAICLLELELGVQHLEASKPSSDRTLRTWFTAIANEYAERTLEFGGKTAWICAKLHLKRPRSERDAMIAACALEHGFTMVTRNVSDFHDTGLSVLDPWRPDE